MNSRSLPGDVGEEPPGNTISSSHPVRPLANNNVEEPSAVIERGAVLAPMGASSSSSGAAEGGAATAPEQAGPEEQDAGGEEALAARPALTPYTPTRAEREAHEATHMPFRSWCWACVQGRSDNPPHRAVPGVEEATARVTL